MGMGMLLLQVVGVFLALVVTSSSSATDDDGPIIGLDFGTYGSSVAVFRDGEVEMIHNQFGDLVTPSWVHSGDAILSVGALAVDLAHRFPHMGNAILGVKRYLGLTVSEVLREVNHLLMPDPATNKTIIRAQSRDKSCQLLHPEYIAGIILASVKKTAELHLGSKITSAVISVPGVYGNTQRQAIIDAATIGGFKTIRLINDPTSIALAYGRSKIEGKKVLVVDFGGSSLDVGVITVDDGNVHVLGGGGSFRLGGHTFNMRLLLLIYEQAMFEKFFFPFHDFPSVLKSWNACEAAKIALSKVETTTIEIQLEDQFKVEHNISIKASRDRFEFLIRNSVPGIKDLILHAIENASLDKKDIDMVLIAGGSSQVPKFKQILLGLHNWKKVVFLKKEQSVAYGAAVYGAILSGKLGTKGNQLHETTRWSVGVEVQSVFKPVFKENDLIPAAKSILLHTPEENVTVYERFSDEDGDYTHRLGSITLPKTCDGNVNVTFSVDANGILQIHDGWNSDAAERVLDRDTVSELANRAGADEVNVNANSVEDAISQGVLTREAVAEIERTVRLARKKSSFWTQDEL